MLKGIQVAACYGRVLSGLRCRATLFDPQGKRWKVLKISRLSSRTPGRLVQSARAFLGGTGLVGAGICAIPVKSVPADKPSSGLPTVNPSSLTTDVLIKNAAAMAVESTSALLTQTFVAMINKYKELAQDIETLMDLTQQQRQAEKLGFVSDELSQAVIAARVDIDDRRHEIQELDAILNSALLSLEAASEAAFQAHQEELAMMGRDRCQYANTQIAMTRAVIQKAERALVRLQADSVRETKTEIKEDEAKFMEYGEHTLKATGRQYAGDKNGEERRGPSQG